MSDRLINEAAVRRFALRVSTTKRAAKFTRVGESFHEGLRADVEGLLRELRNRFPVDAPVGPECVDYFVTGELTSRMEVEINNLIRRLIQRRVQKHPSVGVTLS